MMKRLLAMVGLGDGAGGAASAAKFYKPYAEPHVNTFYNLLFCDDITLFCTESPARAIGPWPTLFAEKLDAEALSSLAADEQEESRIRALAYNRLRAAGHAVPAKKLLGVIVEVPLAGGLDVLAAFSEGGVRYVNQSGKLAVFEGVAAIQPFVQRLFAASEPVVARIGPWEQPRRAPPKQGAVRLTFLVSDGLYFGEGPMVEMQREAMAGPVIQRATDLLQTVVPMATK